MRIKLQTLLKHKLQWLVLLTALLGASQGVWCTVTDIRLTGDFTANGVSPSWSNTTSLSFSNNATGAWYYNTFNVTKAGSAKAVQYNNWDWSYGSGSSNYSLSTGNYNIYANGNCNNGECTLCVVATSKKYTGGSTLYLDCSNYTAYENDNATIKCYLYFDDNCSDSYYAYTYDFAATGTSHIYSIEFPSYPVNSIKIERSVGGSLYNPISITTVSSGNCIQVTSSSAASMTTYSPPSCTTPTSVSASPASANPKLDAATISQTLTATPSGGTGSPDYEWSITSNPNSGASISSGGATATPTVSFTRTGIYVFNVKAGCDIENSDYVQNTCTVTVSKSSNSYYLKHPWDGSNWNWQAMIADDNVCEWTYVGTYGGNNNKFDINTSNDDDGKQYQSDATITGSPSSGDLCVFAFVPSTAGGKTGTASITKIQTYTITGAVDPASGGSVILDPVSGTGVVGSTVTLTASPATGYHIVNWTVGETQVQSGGATYTRTISATDETVTVHFECDTPTLTYNMTGGGLYCSDAKAIGISGSQNGYKYKLYRTASPDVLVETQTGGGSTVAFTAQSTAGTYYVKVMPGTGCSETAITGNPTSVTITAGIHPDKDYFSVSDNDLTYNGTAQQATVESYNTDVYNPASITVKYGSSSGTSDKTDADDYGIYVTAASAVGNFCAVTSAIELDDDLTIAPVTPTAENKATLFTITGVPITVTYDEDPHAASVAWKSPYSCTGTRTIYYKKESDDATTDAPEGAGTYAVTLRVAAGTNNAASESDISLGNIVINKASQDDVNITNAGTYCSNASVTAIATGGSGTGAYTFAKSSGDSGLSINSTTGVITVSNPGSITVTATRAADDNYNVSAASAGATFTFMAAPTAYTLSASGESEAYICSAGGTLTLSDSQSGYSYQLKKDGNAYGDAKAGTGSALVFTVYESGDYTCEAYLTGSPDCKTSMTGTVTLHLSLTPNLLPATPTVKNYEPVVITSINTDIETWTISNAGNTAYLYNITPNSATVKASKANSPYTVTATTSGGCSSTVTVTVGDYAETCN